MSFDYSKLRGRIIEKFGSIEAFAESLQFKIEILASADASSE